MMLERALENQICQALVVGSPQQLFPLRPEEEDLQDAYENKNFYKELDPSDLSLDRGSWAYLCRACGGSTPVRGRVPHCRNCGFQTST